MKDNSEDARRRRSRAAQINGRKGKLAIPFIPVTPRYPELNDPGRLRWRIPTAILTDREKSLLAKIERAAFGDKT